MMGLEANPANRVLASLWPQAMFKGQVLAHVVPGFRLVSTEAVTKQHYSKLFL